MHDNHEPTCSFCAKFVMPFDHDSPLFLSTRPLVKDARSLKKWKITNTLYKRNYSGI